MYLNMEKEFKKIKMMLKQSKFAISLQKRHFLKDNQTRFPISDKMSFNARTIKILHIRNSIKSVGLTG